MKRKIAMIAGIFLTSLSLCSCNTITKARMSKNTYTTHTISKNLEDYKVTGVTETKNTIEAPLQERGDGIQFFNDMVAEAKNHDDFRFVSCKSISVGETYEDGISTLIDVDNSTLKQDFYMLDPEYTMVGTIFYDWNSSINVFDIDIISAQDIEEIGSLAGWRHCLDDFLPSISHLEKLPFFRDHTPLSSPGLTFYYDPSILGNLYLEYYKSSREESVKILIQNYRIISASYSTPNYYSYVNYQYYLNGTNIEMKSKEGLNDLSAAGFPIVTPCEYQWFVLPYNVREMIRTGR